MDLTLHKHEQVTHFPLFVLAILGRSVFLGTLQVLVPPP